MEQYDYQDEEEIRSPFDDTDIAYVHVEVTTRKVFRKKFLGLFNLYDKIPVYRLVYITPSEKIKTDNSYEEYTSHGELYKRLVTQPIYGKLFPNNIKINEFIDLGFTVIIV